MTVFLVALLVSSSELELLAIPQTSQEAGATEENKPLFSVEAYSLARPLPQGSLRREQDGHRSLSSLVPWSLSYIPGLSGGGRNQSPLGGVTSPPCELPKGRRPSPSRGQTK